MGECGLKGKVRPDALTPALSHRERENTKDFPVRKVLLFILRDFFFH